MITTNQPKRVLLRLAHEMRKKEVQRRKMTVTEREREKEKKKRSLCERHRSCFVC